MQAQHTKTSINSYVDKRSVWKGVMDRSIVSIQFLERFDLMMGWADSDYELKRCKMYTYLDWEEKLHQIGLTISVYGMGIHISI